MRLKVNKEKTSAKGKVKRNKAKQKIRAGVTQR